MTGAEKAFFIVLPPTDATTEAKQVVQSVATSGAAANQALFTGLTKAPEGKAMVTFEALTQDVYVRFKTTNSAAGTTSANGLVIKAGQKEVFYLDPLKHAWVDHLGAGVGSLKWYVSSPCYDSYKQTGT